MRRLLPRTFFVQLVLGSVFMQTLFLLLFVWYTVVSQRTIADSRSRVRIIQQLERLAPPCTKYLANGDKDALEDTLELSLIAPSVQTARLTDLAGKTIAVTNNAEGTGLSQPEKAHLPHALQEKLFYIETSQTEGVMPIAIDGKPVALLWLEPNHAALQTTGIMVVRVALSYGGIALLANILPLFLIVRTITRPLLTLRAATQRVVKNPESLEGFPLPVTTVNEAGDLTISFNAMVRELEDQRGGLLETLSLLDSTLGNAPIGFAFLDHDLHYARLNQFFANVFRLPIEQLLGRKSTDLPLGPLAAEIERHVALVFASAAPIRDIELTESTPQPGEAPRSWLVHFYPVRAAHGAIKWVGVIMVETTERLQAEEVLRRTEKLAAAGRLAASIAHEINNPLESVTNLLFLLRTHEPMDALAMQYVATAEAELARVSEITQQTLRFYRQSSLPAITQVSELMDSVITLYQPRLNQSHVIVQRRFADTGRVFGFHGELRQLFANFVGNAVDAMPHGGRLHLRIRRGTGLCLDGTWCTGVRVSVADTGSGMSPETRARIFEAFFTTKQATGTGLGLWVSEEIIRKHSGSIRVRSRQGERSGTAFLLFFPDRPTH